MWWKWSHVGLVRLLSVTPQEVGKICYSFIYLTPDFYWRRNDLSMRSALFWDITHRRVVILYRRFGTTYRSHLQRSRSQRRKWRMISRVGRFFLPRCSCLTSEILSHEDFWKRRFQDKPQVYRLNESRRHCKTKSYLSIVMNSMLIHCRECIWSGGVHLKDVTFKDRMLHDRCVFLSLFYTKYWCKLVIL